MAFRILDRVRTCNPVRARTPSSMAFRLRAHLFTPPHWSRRTAKCKAEAGAEKRLLQTPAAKTVEAAAVVYAEAETVRAAIMRAFDKPWQPFDNLSCSPLHRPRHMEC